MKLNLGSRNRSLEGFHNVDCDAHPNVDTVADVSSLPFPENSAEIIYASHILEHFPHPKTISVLREWCRVLLPDGRLFVAVPDFERAVALYYATGLQDWIVNFLYGDQEYKTAYHYTAFDEKRLRDFLQMAGFDRIERVAMFPFHAIGDCSTNLSTYDRQPVSLNMIAHKRDPK